PPPREQTPLPEAAAAIFFAQLRCFPLNIERLLGLARANQAVALLVEPIHVAHRIGRRLVVDSNHPIDQLPQVLAPLETSLAQLPRNRHVADPKLPVVRLLP